MRRVVRWAGAHRGGRFVQRFLWQPQHRAQDVGETVAIVIA
jgi:hypothetical protein